MPPSLDKPRHRRRTDARHQALHAALLDAAEQLLEQDGLPGLRARTLAERAGCALGAIYTVVPDLDALVLEVNGRTLDAIERTLSDVPAGSEPETVLVGLADAYLTYVALRPRRALALFAHAMTGGRPVPDWYRALQERVFAPVEGPLARLRPDLSREARALLARTLFSAVHGIVALGLDQKLAPMEGDTLRMQLRLAVLALARGLRAA